MVVTNLRLPADEYQQMRIIAAEKGISVNQYIRDSLEKIGLYQQLGIAPDKKKKTTRKKLSIWDLPKLAKLKDAPMGLSEEDQIIYG